MKTLDVIAAVLVIIGGLNWGLVGLFDFNLVTYLFGHYPVIPRVVFTLVGLAAVYQIFAWRGIQRRWP